MTGLNAIITLNNGGIKLSGGDSKAKDSLWFYCVFDKYRVYNSSFGGDFQYLLQKPRSSLISNRTLILGKLQKGIEDNVPNVKLKNLDIGYFSDNIKNINLMVSYSVKGDQEQEITNSIFI